MDTFAQIADSLHILPPRFHIGHAQPGSAPTLRDLMSDSDRLAAWLAQDAAKVGAPGGQAGPSMLVQNVAMLLGGGRASSTPARVR